MATTTEKYAITIELENGSVSPFGLGKALAAALATMPDDTLNWVFEEGASSYKMNLLDPYVDLDAKVIGEITFWPMSTEDEAERVATAITMGLDEFDEDGNLL